MTTASNPATATAAPAQELARPRSTACPNRTRPEHERTTGAAACLRTLCILAILFERTDAHTFMTSQELRKALAEPSDPRLPSLEVGRGAVRSSIDALRACGIRILSSQRHGYALVGHPLGSRDAELAIRAICSSRLLNAAQRARIAESILRFASPTEREALMPRYSEREIALGESDAPRRQTTRPFYFTSPQALIQLALESNASFVFELVPARRAQISHGAASTEPAGYGRRHRMRPTSIFVHNGTLFVQGLSLDSHAEDVAIERTIRIDRMANLAFVDDDGILHISCGAAAPLTG